MVRKCFAGFHVKRRIIYAYLLLIGFIYSYLGQSGTGFLTKGLAMTLWAQDAYAGYAESANLTALRAELALKLLLPDLLSVGFHIFLVTLLMFLPPLHLGLQTPMTPLIQPLLLWFIPLVRLAKYQKARVPYTLLHNVSFHVQLSPSKS